MDIFRNLTMVAHEQATVLPYLTFRLAQDGVQVIRMEHPVFGDPNRKVGENALGEEGINTYYLCINAGKKAVTLNLAEPEGQEIFRSLIQKLEVDIFATQLLPRNYKKLGIDYETLKSIKPDIIWLGVTGFGPDSNEPAYDPILQARSGLMDLTGEPDGDPQYMGIPLPDMGTSMHAYALLMKALYKREATGEGSCINMSMFESSISWLTVPITMAASFGKVMSRRGNTHPFFSPASVFRTKDRYVYIATGNDRQWKSVVSLEPFKSLDKPEYETNQGRNRDVENLNRAINEITERFSADDLVKMFHSITVPIGTVEPITEVLQDPLVKRRLLYAQDPVSGRKITLAPAPHTTEFLEGQDRLLSFPPRFGEHNEEIYCGVLGLSKKELEELKGKKII